ncbi:biotin--[acetyl-CoA-carboxylase] ligase [Candidatus Poribacteria bacterium]|nr:biotin--[acetyl-CoA-carboxylase] ligase [Candidatus Poribacteria bacterium]
MSSEMSIKDLMTAENIKSGLEAKILGQEIISYIQTTSTNDVALQLAERGLKEGTIIVAENQTAGRGRRNKKWIAPMGTSILASIILRPSVKIHSGEVITLISASAVVQAIRSIAQLLAFIKWPNDVVINSKKASGILTEMRIEKGSVKYAVVGIGVTVNITQERLPLEIKDIATSLSIESRQEVSRIRLFQEIIRQLEQRYIRLCNDDMQPLIAEWKSLSATIGQQVQINFPKHIIRGEALDIDESGAILIRQDTNQIHKIKADMDFKSIVLVKKSIE